MNDCDESDPATRVGKANAEWVYRECVRVLLRKKDLAAFSMQFVERFYSD